MPESGDSRANVPGGLHDVLRDVRVDIPRKQVKRVKIQVHGIPLINHKMQIIFMLINNKQSQIIVSSIFNTEVCPL